MQSVTPAFYKVGVIFTGERETARSLRTPALTVYLAHGEGIRCQAPLNFHIKHIKCQLPLTVFPVSDG